MLQDKKSLEDYGITLQDTTEKARKLNSLFYRNEKVLSSSEQRELFVKIKESNDEGAKEKLLLTNKPLIYFTIKKYISKMNLKHIQFDDLVQEGIIGLSIAIDKFDLKSGSKFSTYAVWWIRQRIERYIQDNESDIRMPIYLHEAYSKYQKLIQKYVSKNGIMPDDQYVITTLSIPDSILEICKNWNKYNTLSLDKKINDDDEGRDFGNFVANKDNFYDSLNSDIDRKIILYALKKYLTPINYYILYYRFFEPHSRTLEEIGTTLDITHERVRQIERNGLKLLKKKLGDRGNGFNRLLQGTPDLKNILNDID